MKKLRLFAGSMLAVGMLAAGTMSASAAEYRDGDHALAAGYHHELSRVTELRREIAVDQVRLAQDQRVHSWRAATRDRQELARDQRELNSLEHGRNDWR